MSIVRTLPVVAATAILGSGLLATAGPAQAGRPFERGTYDETSTYTLTLCGRVWDITSHQWGHYQLRATEDGAPDVLVHDSNNYANVAVAQDNGDTFRREGKDNFRIREVTRVEGDTWLIELSSSGRPWTLMSASGQVVWADRGIFYTHILVDTRGDDDPENDVYDVTSDWSGPHFLSDTLPGSEYCTYVARAIELG